MRIVEHADYEINFLSDAIWDIKNRSQSVTIPLENGMKLLIGKRRRASKIHQYNIVLQDGRKHLTVVQLNEIGVTKDNRLICEPHTYTRKQYRGNRYAEQIYCWLLENGIVLRSCGRQTWSSHTMWMKLSFSFKLRAYNKVKRQYCDLSQIETSYVVLELSRT